MSRKRKLMLLSKLILCLYILVPSCNNDKTLETIYIRNDNGQIVSKMNYYITTNGDTIVNGVAVHYFPNGNVSDSFFMKDGKKDGIYYKFDSTGKLNRLSTMSNNKIDGHVYYFFSNNVIESDQFYKEDSLIYIRNYYMTGRLKNYFIFKNKIETAYLLRLDSTGKIETEVGDSLSLKSK